VPPAGVVTLRSAIAEANTTPGGNTINLTVPGDYKITIRPAAPDDTPATENNATGDFDILPGGGNLLIQNTSGGHVAVDGNFLDRIFDINPNFDPANVTPAFTVTLEGFTIQNGIASPGGTGNGGGIRDRGNASLTLTNMVVTNNRAAVGGGIKMENSVSTPWTLTINNSTITNNHATGAGGVATDGSGMVFINPGTVISSNISVTGGGGVCLNFILSGNVLQSANLNITGALIRGNQALIGSGGGICNGGNGAVTITKSTIDGNFAGVAGGGFVDLNNRGTLTVMQSLFSNNAATGSLVNGIGGGGIVEMHGITRIIKSEIKGNSTGAEGGGIYVAGTALRMLSSTVAGNTAAGGGGGIELETSGAGANGSTIITSTITGNTALSTTVPFTGSFNGGGIEAQGGFTGSLVLLNDTINLNFAANGGGIFWVGAAGSSFSVQNTIIARNFVANGGAGPDANNPAATFTDKGGNLIGVSGSGSGNTGFTAATTQIGTVGSPLDPLLGDLGNNGGPIVGAAGSSLTLETEAPLGGSPAIDKGILPGAPTMDERGFSFVVNGKINVGAVSHA
jgi:hypothetical protein